MNGSAVYNDTDSVPNSMNSFNYFQVSWQQICFILGITANAYLLHSIIVNKAVKLDSMSLWIINNLAVVDIANCIFILLPILISQYGKIGGTLIFGQTFFKFWTPWCYSCFVANVFLVNALSMNKLMRCVFPLRNLVTTKCQKLGITLLTSFFSFVMVATEFNAIFSGEYQPKERLSDVKNYYGSSLYSQPRNVTNIQFKNFKFVVIPIIFCLIPCCLLTLTNFALVFYAIRKAKRNINTSNILVVVLVTTVFLVSYVPELISVARMEEEDYSKQHENFWSLIWLSCWTNPFIYLTVNPSFREFTRKKLCPSQ